MDVPEAALVETESGLEPSGPGWFIVNVADARWDKNERSGAITAFENWREGPEFPHFGINICVLQPGEPNGKYHAESAQEAFLVLEGECTLLVEGQERTMRKWDFFHCAPHTTHIAVGAGDGPCAILMVGARFEGATLHYPLHPLAEKYGVQTTEDTDDPKVAYADWHRVDVPAPDAWPVNQ